MLQRATKFMSMAAHAPLLPLIFFQLPGPLLTAKGWMHLPAGTSDRPAPELLPRVIGSADDLFQEHTAPA